MPQPSNLERAIQLALTAHEGQRDWNGRPFILHPMRVGMDLLQRYDEVHAAVGVLHDSIEDSDGRVTHTVIEAACGTLIADTVRILTRVKGQEYGDYLDLVAQDRIATRVKLADLTDNLSPFRLMVGNAQQMRAFQRHGQAYHELREIATNNAWI